MSPSSDSRDRLIASAQRLLWDVGYEAMSPRMIIADSGVGQGSLYHHFKGKKDLAVAALDALMRDILATAAKALQDNTIPPEERLNRWLTMPRQALRGCRMGRLTPEQSMTDQDINAPIARYFSQTQAMLEAVLDAMAQRGTLPPGADPAILAQTLLAVVQGGYVLSRAHQDPNRLDQAVLGARSLLGLGP